MPSPKHLTPPRARRAAPWRGGGAQTWSEAVGLATATGLAVYLLGLASVSFRPDGSSLALWWPAAGVATAGVLLTPARRRWLTLTAVGTAATATTLGSGRPLLVDAALVLGNVVTPAVFAGVVESRAHGRRLRTLADVTRFCLATLLASACSGALVGVTALPALGSAAGITGLGFAAAHAAAMLVLVPFVFELPTDARPRRVRAHDRWLVPLHVTGTLALVVAVYGPDQRLPLALLVLPVLMLGATVLPPRWMSAELLLAGTATSTLTAAGNGPFSLPALGGTQSPEVVVLLGQMTLACYAIAVLPMMVASHQLRAAAGSAAMTAREYRSVVEDATGTAIIGFDLDGTIEMFSAGAQEMLGYTAEEAVGARGTELWHDPVELAARARELGTRPGFSTVVAASEALSRSGRLDWKVWSRDGRPLVLSQRLTPRYDGVDSGEQTGWVAVAEDVTRRRGMESALRGALEREREARERAEQLEALRSAFVANVSHELRTPLTSMIGYTALALTDLDTAQPQVERHRGLLEAAQRNSRRLLHLVEDLLVLSRVEARRLEPRYTDVDVRSLVDGSLEALGPSGQRSQVPIEVVGPERPVVLRGDREQVERVVTNLLSNAVKFAPSGSTVLLEYGIRGAVVFLRVRDDGPGIPFEERELVFETFYQGESARARELPGSGLGLSIARTIVEAHGGSIMLLDGPGGRGTVVEMCLPRVGAIPRPPNGTERRASAGSPTAGWSTL